MPTNSESDTSRIACSYLSPRISYRVLVPLATHLVSRARTSRHASTTPDRSQPHGFAPIHLAAAQGHTPIVRLLLESNANLRPAKDTASGVQGLIANPGSGLTPLHLAATRGHGNVVQFLLVDHKVDPNVTKTTAGATPLHLASKRGHRHVVSLLLANNANPNQEMDLEGGTTPVFSAAEQGHASIVSLLLEAKANPNHARPDDGATPLFIAAQQNHADVVETLVTNGADPNQAISDLMGFTERGFTPLYTAVVQGLVTVVSVLLHHGANPNIATTGSMPVCALQFVDDEAAALQIAQLLVVFGADLIATDETRRTAVEGAVRKGMWVLGCFLEGITRFRGEGGEWPRLKVAAACRLHREVAFMLRKGWLDPELDARACTAITTNGCVDAVGRFQYPAILHTIPRHSHSTADGDPHSLFPTPPNQDPNSKLLEAVTAAGSAFHQFPWNAFGRGGGGGGGDGDRAGRDGAGWASVEPVCRKTMKLVLQATQGWAPSRHCLHHTAFRKVVVAVLLVGQRLDAAARRRSSADSTPVLPSSRDRNGPDDDVDGEHFDSEHGSGCGGNGGDSGCVSMVKSTTDDNGGTFLYNKHGNIYHYRQHGGSSGGNPAKGSGADEAGAQAEAVGRGVGAEDEGELWLPPEMWLSVMEFCLRSWWPAPSNRRLNR